MERSLLYYQVALERLQSQETLTTEFGTKATGVLGLGLAILTASAVILSFSAVSFGIGEPTSWLFFCLIVAFLATAWGCSKILRPYDWERGPKLTTLYNHLSSSYTTEILTEWVSDAYKDSVEHNKEVLSKKAVSLQWSIYALIAETVLLALITVCCGWLS